MWQLWEQISCQWRGYQSAWTPAYCICSSWMVFGQYQRVQNSFVVHLISSFDAASKQLCPFLFLTPGSALFSSSSLTKSVWPVKLIRALWHWYHGWNSTTKRRYFHILLQTLLSPGIDEILEEAYCHLLKQLYEGLSALFYSDSSLKDLDHKYFATNRLQSVCISGWY